MKQLKYKIKKKLDLVAVCDKNKKLLDNIKIKILENIIVLNIY